MTVSIGRRELLAALGGAAATWPLAARGQQPAMPVIGFLSSETPSGYGPFAAAFRQGLSESKAATWRSNIAGRRVTTIGCRRSRPSWCAGRSSWRASQEGGASGCPRARIADTDRPGQHRTRHRSDLRKLGPTRGRRAGRLAQCVLRQPPRSNRRAWRYVTRCLPSTSSANSLPPAG